MKESWTTERLKKIYNIYIYILESSGRASRGLDSFPDSGYDTNTPHESIPGHEMPVIQFFKLDWMSADWRSHWRCTPHECTVNHWSLITEPLQEMSKKPVFHAKASTNRNVRTSNILGSQFVKHLQCWKVAWHIPKFALPGDPKMMLF